MDEIISLRSIQNDLETEIAVFGGDTFCDEKGDFIYSEAQQTECEAKESRDRLSEINRDIERLTCNADRSDYALSAVCGALAGRLAPIISKSLKLGYGNIRSGRKSDDGSVENKKTKRPDDSDDNAGESRNTELLADGGANAEEIRNTERSEDRNDNLAKSEDPAQCYDCDNEREEKCFFDRIPEKIASNCGKELPKNDHKKLSESKSLLGLVLSVAEQFSTAPDFCPSSSELSEELEIEITPRGYFVGRHKESKIFSGILNWFFKIASASEKERGIGGRTERMLSPLISLAGELSELSCVKDERFFERLHSTFSAYVNGSGGKRLKAELDGVFSGSQSEGMLKKQQLAVTLNELLVRAVFFVKGFIRQMNEKHSLVLLDYSALMPHKDRTLGRMLSVSLGVFTAIDVTRAALRSASGGMTSIPTFLFNMVLKVNVAGIGRFLMTVRNDAEMLSETETLRNERIELCGQCLLLSATEVFYKQAGMWRSAGSTVRTLTEVSGIAERAIAFHVKAIEDMTEDIRQSVDVLQRKKEKESDFLKELDEILIYE